jgi:hypothetical protein
MAAEHWTSQRPTAAFIASFAGPNPSYFTSQTGE